MPGLSGRMSVVIKSKISKLLDRAEDPAETLEYSYQKQVELLQNVKKGIADVVTSKKRLQLQEQKLRDQVVKLDTQARTAPRPSFSRWTRRSASSSSSRSS
jgi:phage shock protein A